LRFWEKPGQRPSIKTNKRKSKASAVGRKNEGIRTGFPTSEKRGDGIEGTSKEKTREAGQGGNMESNMSSRVSRGEEKLQREQTDIGPKKYQLKRALEEFAL